jgi:putative transposase
VLIQRKRDTRAAARLMRKLLKKQGFAPTEIVTDRLAVLRCRVPRTRSLGAAHPRQAEEQPGGELYNTFNLCRHLVSAKTHRRLRSETIIVRRCAAGVTA